MAGSLKVVLLDDIADMLSSGGVGTVGTDLFKGFLPETDAAVVALYETGGRGPDIAMGAGPIGSTVAMEWPRVQVVCRSGEYDYATARSKAHDIFKLLHGLPARLINGTSYQWASAVQSPFLMGRDDSNRVLIACNYDVAKALST